MCFLKIFESSKIFEGFSIFEDIRRFFQSPKNLCLRLRSIFMIRRIFVFVFGPFLIFVATLAHSAYSRMTSNSVVSLSMLSSIKLNNHRYFCTSLSIPLPCLFSCRWLQQMLISFWSHANLDFFSLGLRIRSFMCICNILTTEIAPKTIIPIY